jgi:hypothetical protein
MSKLDSKNLGYLIKKLSKENNARFFENNTWKVFDIMKWVGVTKN